MRVLGCIIAGGKSTRMGRNKAFIVWRGMRLIDHVAARLMPQVDALVINANEAGDFGHKVIADSIDLGTPLAGLHAALSYAKENSFDAVLTAPCDTPLLPKDLRARLQGEGAAIAVSCGQAHYLCGLWPVATLQKIAGLRRVMDFADSCAARRIAWAIDEVDPFINVNAPEDAGAAAMNMKATAIGFLAIVMWATLAAITAAAGKVPPFQLTAMTFALGGLMGAASWPFRKGAMAKLKQDWRVWALGIGGLFSYHALYFAAIQNAPAIDVSLIAYLWPTLIVVLSGFLPGEKLKAHHVIGVLLGFCGAALIITRGQGLGLGGGLKLGHWLAFLLPPIWAGYSLLARRTGDVPTDVVAGFCLATAALSLVAHLMFEQTVWPQGGQWIAVAALGLFPVGVAFYVWDYGLKRGDIFVLGALSYCSPLFSTLILLASGMTPFHWSIAVACILITLGAVVAARDTFRR